MRQFSSFQRPMRMQQWRIMPTLTIPPSIRGVGRQR
jgi:hypothetical protein